jgi:hypothetical protein
VDVAGQAFAFPAGRLDLDRVLAFGLHLGGEPGQVADDHAGQQQEHYAVEHHGDRLAAQQEVAAGQDQRGDRARSPAVLHRPGQHRPGHPDPGHRHHPARHGRRVLQGRGR